MKPQTRPERKAVGPGRPMTHRHRFAVYRFGRHDRHGPAQMRGDLVTEKIEIDPAAVCAARATTRYFGKEMAGGFQVGHPKSQVGSQCLKRV